MSLPKKDWRDQSASVSMMDTRGIYRKFIVERTDGDPTGKHKSCVYFVLDLTHDENAPAALKAYAKSCAKKRPQLAKDLKWALGLSSGPKGEFFPSSLDAMVLMKMKRDSGEM